MTPPASPTRRAEIRGAVAVALVVALTGCSSTVARWVKPAATADDFNRDSYDCACPRPHGKGISPLTPHPRGALVCGSDQQGPLPRLPGQQGLSAGGDRARKRVEGVGLTLQGVRASVAVGDDLRPPPLALHRQTRSSRSSWWGAWRSREPCSRPAAADDKVACCFLYERHHRRRGGG